MTDAAIQHLGQVAFLIAIIWAAVRNFESVLWFLDGHANRKHDSAMAQACTCDPDRADEDDDDDDDEEYRCR